MWPTGSCVVCVELERGAIVIGRCASSTVTSESLPLTSATTRLPRMPVIVFGVSSSATSPARSPPSCTLKASVPLSRSTRVRIGSSVIVTMERSRIVMVTRPPISTRITERWAVSMRSRTYTWSRTFAGARSARTACVMVPSPTSAAMAPIGWLCACASEGSAISSETTTAACRTKDARPHTQCQTANHPNLLRVRRSRGHGTVRAVTGAW